MNVQLHWGVGWLYMGWEIDSIDEIECPCGQGKIICENKSDGWNRYDENVYLQCETCKKDII